MEMIDRGRFIEVDGKMLGKLSPNDRATLLAPVAKALRERLRETLKEAGISGEQYANELDAFDNRIWGNYEFHRFIQSMDGRAAVLELAAGKPGATSLEGLAFDTEDDFILAAKLSGIKLLPPDKEKLAAFENRERYKSDLTAAGITGDDFLAHVEQYDTAHDGEPERPSAADS